MTTILGIDPGSMVTGYGILQESEGKIRYVSSGCIKLKKGELPSKLQNIYQEISKITNLYNVQEVAVESVFMHRNVSAALKLGQARGAAIVGASTYNCSFFEYTARQVKQSVVGYGGAQKLQIQHMVMQLLNLSGKIQEDSADALAVAICHANNRKSRNIIGEYKSFKKGRII
ncbi:MAG: crossover junction endodeoxyribonuclease RuvC [Legionellales bacterium]|nr:crossover junction endodeoxyribonuclease RuvC [Legionellales bacterium]